MNARNERLNAAMLSLDRLLAGRDPAKDPLLGDGGEGAARIYRALDPERGACATPCRACAPPDAATSSASSNSSARTAATAANPSQHSKTTTAKKS